MMEIVIQNGSSNEELRRMASTDKRTGIANRSVFDETLNREWERLKREKKGKKSGDCLHVRSYDTIQTR